MAQFRSLDPHKIVQTLERLGRRIGERFPGSGLGQLCDELRETAGHAAGRAASLEEPNLAIRLAVAGLVAVGLALLIALGTVIASQPAGSQADSLYGMLQGVDSAFNIIVLAGAAVVFLARIEQLGKRQRALRDLHELRSLIHVIDMHQLTKDPGMALAPGPATPSSPRRMLSPFELTRYLDYCSEMLSLASKIAALYAQSSQDGTVIAAVNDVEQLSTNLCEKIWQKIAILQGELDSDPPSPPSAAPPANPTPAAPAA